MRKIALAREIDVDLLPIIGAERNVEDAPLFFLDSPRDSADAPRVAVRRFMDKRWERREVFERHCGAFYRPLGADGRAASFRLVIGMMINDTTRRVSAWRGSERRPGLALTLKAPVFSGGPALRSPRLQSRPSTRVWPMPKRRSGCWSAGDAEKT